MAKHNPAFSPPCDVVITRDQKVFINGHQMGGVTEIEVEAVPLEPTRVRIEMIPNSLVYGDPPTGSLGGLSAVYDDANGEARVDIHKAIESARKRVARKGDSNQLTSDDPDATVGDPDRNNDPFKHD